MRRAGPPALCPRLPRVQRRGDGGRGAPQDDQGRTIRFDVRVEGVDVEWYAALLRAAPHGSGDLDREDRCRLVGRGSLRPAVAEASGCYSRRTIVVPASRRREAHTRSCTNTAITSMPRPVPGVAEPNGTPEWWRARAVARSSCASEASPYQLHPRAGAQHRRDLRRGLRTARPGRLELQDRLARSAGRDGVRGPAGRLRAWPAPAAVNHRR